MISWGRLDFLTADLYFIKAFLCQIYSSNVSFSSSVQTDKLPWQYQESAIFKFFSFYLWNESCSLNTASSCFVKESQTSVSASNEFHTVGTGECWSCSHTHTHTCTHTHTQVKTKFVIVLPSCQRVQFECRCSFFVLSLLFFFPLGDLESFYMVAMMIQDTHTKKKNVPVHQSHGSICST